MRRCRRATSDLERVLGSAAQSIVQIGNLLQEVDTITLQLRDVTLQPVHGHLCRREIALQRTDSGPGLHEQLLELPLALQRCRQGVIAGRRTDDSRRLHLTA